MVGRKQHVYYISDIEIKYTGLYQVKNSCRIIEITKCTWYCQAWAQIQTSSTDNKWRKINLQRFKIIFLPSNCILYTFISFPLVFRINWAVSFLFLITFYEVLQIYGVCALWRKSLLTVKVEYLSVQRLNSSLLDLRVFKQV